MMCLGLECVRVQKTSLKAAFFLAVDLRYSKAGNATSRLTSRLYITRCKTKLARHQSARVSNSGS